MLKAVPSPRSATHLVDGIVAASSLAARRVRNVVRARLQSYGTKAIKRSLWNREFAGGRWDCLESTPGDYVYAFVEKYASQGSILDLGCGSGSTGTELDVQAYQHYTGVDISDVAIDKARRRSEGSGRGDRNRYVQSDIVEYVPSQSFDVILFRDSIYYVAPRAIHSMLDRYASYLTPRGVFIVRIAGRPDRFRHELDVIDGKFDVVERRLYDDPEAIVTVFRPRHAQAPRTR